MKITRYIYSALVILFLQCIAITAVAQRTIQSVIHPIEMGDKIPEEIWNRPFQVVRHNTNPETIKLRDYKGKTIVLDFWATWCTGCILSMPRMHVLAAAYPNDVVLLPVTYEAADLISDFLRKTASPQIREHVGEFRTIVNGQVLKDLIPHETIPRIAVINPSGVLEQVTMPHLLNTEILGKIIKQEQYYIPKYRGDLDTSSILSATYTDIKSHKTIYYTALTGMMDGFNHSSKEIKDSLNGAIRGHLVNRPLFHLFHMAVRPTFNPRFPSRRIMMMDDPSQLDFFHERNPRYEKKKFNFSYEYVLPIDWTVDQIRKRMHRDIEDYTGFYARVIERKIPCLIIRALGKEVFQSKFPNERPKFVKEGISQARVPERASPSETGAKTYLLASSVSALVWILNDLKESAVPFVIDESGIDYKIDLDLPDDLGDISALKAVLEKQGLAITIEERKMEMFVVSETPIDANQVMTVPLQLTKFGYKPEH